MRGAAADMGQDGFEDAGVGGKTRGLKRPGGPKARFRHNQSPAAATQVCEAVWGLQ
jgi:hypothetical protein